MSTSWDDPRVASLEAALARCMHDHGCVCTEMHAFRRERDALQTRLKNLIEAAQRYLRIDTETPEQHGYYPPDSEAAEKALRAAIEKAKVST